MKVDQIYCDGCGNRLKDDEKAVSILFSTKIKTKVNFAGNQLTDGAPELVKDEKHFCEKCSDFVDSTVDELRKNNNYSIDKIRQSLNTSL